MSQFVVVARTTVDQKWIPLRMYVILCGSATGLVHCHISLGGPIRSLQFTIFIRQTHMHVNPTSFGESNVARASVIWLRDRCYCLSAVDKVVTTVLATAFVNYIGF